MTPFVMSLPFEDFINESLNTDTLLQVSCDTIHPYVKRVVDAAAGDPLVDTFASIIDGQVAECTGSEFAKRLLNNAQERGMVEIDGDGNEVLVIPTDFFPDYLSRVASVALIASGLAERDLGKNESNFLPSGFLVLFDAVITLLNASRDQDTEAANQAMTTIIRLGEKYSDALTRIGVEVVKNTPLPDEDSLSSNMDEPPDGEEFYDIDF